MHKILQKSNKNQFLIRKKKLKKKLQKKLQEKIKFLIIKMYKK